jgi:hypothetical protein
VNLGPIGLDLTPMALFGAGSSEQRRLQRGVGHLGRQWPLEPGTRQPFQAQPDSRRRNTYSAGNLVKPDPSGPQTKQLAHLAHRCPLCWHPLPPQKPKERTLFGPAEAPLNRATSSRNAGRNHLGTPSEIKSEGWATSSRIRGRLPPESAILRSEPQFCGLKHDHERFSSGKCRGRRIARSRVGSRGGGCQEPCRRLRRNDHGSPE